MHGQNKQVLCERQAQKFDPKERTHTQIESTLPFFRRKNQSVLFPLIFGQVIEGDAPQLHGRRGADRRHHMAVHCVERSSQGIVSLHNRL